MGWGGLIVGGTVLCFGIGVRRHGRLCCRQDCWRGSLRGGEERSAWKLPGTWAENRALGVWVLLSVGLCGAWHTRRVGSFNSPAKGCRELLLSSCDQSLCVMPRRPDRDAFVTNSRPRHHGRRLRMSCFGGLDVGFHERRTRRSEAFGQSHTKHVPSRLRSCRVWVVGFGRYG